MLFFFPSNFSSMGSANFFCKVYFFSKLISLVKHLKSCVRKRPPFFFLIQRGCFFFTIRCWFEVEWIKHFFVPSLKGKHNWKMLFPGRKITNVLIFQALKSDFSELSEEFQQTDSSNNRLLIKTHKLDLIYLFNLTFLS